MKEDQVYSIHSKNNSPTPQKAGSTKPVAATSTTPSNKPKNPEPVPQPKPKIQQSVVEQRPEPDEAEKNRIAQERAIELARSKINAIYGDQSLSAKPDQAPQIATGYATEQVLQTEISPSTTPPVQPDRQLPEPKLQQQYGAYSLPGTVKPPQPVQHSPAPTKKKPVRAIKDKIKKTNIKQKAKTQLAKAKKIKEKVKGASRTTKSSSQTKPLWHRLAPAVGLMLAITLILNNQLVYGQISYYVTPGNRIETPTIVESQAGDRAPAGERIIIPKINVDVPINYKVETYDEDAIQRGLEDGIVHYANTGMPGKVGNNVLLGHNTNNFWNSGKYKTAFVLLDRLKEGDTFEIHHNSTRYVYEIYKKKIIEPDDFSVVTQKVTEPVVTLITCHPPGTSWKRLIIQAKQISPEPPRSDKTVGNELTETPKGNVPGAAPGALESIFDWLF